ncbi:restriction endonuclease subunit S [Blautia massiliensis (ex Durand et al. 2017)]|nr:MULTISPECIES: restriction endonuclease subunit S [Blautia]UEA27441.1 restriction endonuclease subunit S [Blautia massiliensis (ex Durand et al. 2017)]UWO15826.1 restriction endonuclease subunit S [Blautia sp. KLE_1732_HM_1032]
MKLIDVCDFQGGSQPPKEEWAFEEQDGYIRMLQIRDFTQSEKVIPEYIKVSNSTKTCEVDDILIARYGASIGKILTGLAGAYNVAIMRTVPDTSKVQKRYLYYYLKSPYFQNAILNVGSRAAQAGFNKEDLSKLEIKCPALIDQGEIVSVLEKVESVIQKRKQELQLLDNLIKARFVELFVGKKYEIVKAGSIIKEMRNGVSPSTSGGHFEKVLTLSAITQGKFDDKAWKEGFFTDCPSAEKRITEDDFYICRGNGNKSLVGMGVYALENRPDLVFPDTVIAAHIDTERMVLPYLWIMWQQPEVRKQLESGARTTNGTYKINQKVISEIKIICPPINEQEVFADFVKQANKSKVKVQKALDETQKLFDSLMQQYFG